MSGLYILAPTLLTILFSMMIVRAGAIALTMTGMSYNRAKFQSLSAFSGTGFTTREAELVVNHPARRRIVSWMMVLGNAGIVAVIITATSSFVFSDLDVLPLNIAVLFGGILVLYILATRTGLAARWETFVERRLGKSTLFEEGAVDELLHLIEGYGLVKLTVESDSPFLGRTLSDIRLSERGFRVLGIERDRDWIAAPHPAETLQEDDRLVIYGQLDALRRLPRQG